MDSSRPHATILARHILVLILNGALADTLNPIEVEANGESKQMLSIKHCSSILVRGYYYVWVGHRHSDIVVGVKCTPEASPSPTARIAILPGPSGFTHLSVSVQLVETIDKLLLFFHLGYS